MAQNIVETTLPASGRPVTVALPAAPSPPGAPLVVSLHYGGPAGPYYGRGLLEHVIAPGLSALGAVMVAPDCPAPAWADSTCESAVFEAIDLAVERHGADPARVVLAGYSKGGIGTWALVDAHPDRFVAAVVMAGRAPARPGEGEVPTYVLHGENDELFPIAAVAAAVEARRNAGAQVRFTPLPGVTHYDTGAFVDALDDVSRWLLAGALR